MAKLTKRLVVSGRVQGVGYRYSMHYAARNFGVTGWVRNRRDGTVEAVAQGEEPAVQAFIAWAWKGPGLAQVDNVAVEDAAGDFRDFEIRSSA